ncbi:hypothetical protein ACFPRL_11740 [Pseudoclavibacter helvolus]
MLRDEGCQALSGDIDGDHATALARDARRRGLADAGTGARDDDRLPGEAAAGDRFHPRRGPGRSRGVEVGDGAERSWLSGGDLAAVHARDHRIHHLLRELALAELDELREGHARDWCEGGGVLAALSEDLADDDAARRVGEPFADGVRGGEGVRVRGHLDASFLLGPPVSARGAPSRAVTASDRTNRTTLSGLCYPGVDSSESQSGTECGARESSCSHRGRKGRVRRRGSRRAAQRGRQTGGGRPGEPLPALP